MGQRVAVGLGPSQGTDVTYNSVRCESTEFTSLELFFMMNDIFKYIIFLAIYWTLFAVYVHLVVRVHYKFGS